MARVMDLNELRFFISVRVPSSSEPMGRTDRFTSQRSEPSCILQSDTPRYSSVLLSFSRYAMTSSPERKSGSVTISMSGTPQRL